MTNQEDLGKGSDHQTMIAGIISHAKDAWRDEVLGMTYDHR